MQEAIMAGLIAGLIYWFGVIMGSLLPVCPPLEILKEKIRNRYKNTVS